MSDLDWVIGDRFGLRIPAHSAALRAGGESFLSGAFGATGALSVDNRVSRVTKLEDCAGGSTGRKAFLSVAYDRCEPDLHAELFVKFSRDVDDPIRDRSKIQLESEVKLALLSRTPGFPIAVPACLFADYHRESGTGILITQRIAFGKDGVERPYEKCRDSEMQEPLAHYNALLRSLARLAGAHKAGRLDQSVAESFPFDATEALTRDRIRYTEQQLLKRVARYAEFSAKFPQLLPRNIRSPEFLIQLAQDVPRFVNSELAIKQYLHGNSKYIALCHWNANVDNAWFWRNAHGELECGLMDWGHVGQMNVALALFGSLSAAEIEVWDRHLVELLTQFVAELNHCGGPLLDVQELKFQLLLFVAMMGLAWLMDAPALIQMQLNDLSQITDRFDPRFRCNETARVQLHMLTTVLNLWQTENFGALLDRFLRRM
jgi:hypothetical protein